MTKRYLARGIRNNNPGNIRKSNNQWVGKIKGTDPDFETFDTAENGIRAIAVLLQTYRNKGIKTPRAIVERYAPKNENNSDAYMKLLAGKLGIGVDDSTENVPMENIVKAIISIENGTVPYTLSQIKTGVNRA